jgi:hypothetical protein
MPLEQFNKLNKDADAQLKQLAALGDCCAHARPQ